MYLMWYFGFANSSQKELDLLFYFAGILVVSFYLESSVPMAFSKIPNEPIVCSSLTFQNFSN